MNYAAQLLVRHGDTVLFAWVFAEQAGLPMPAIPLLLAVGSLASSGRMNLAWSVGLAWSACLMADSLWYQIGRWHGPRVLRLLCRISLEPDSCARRSEVALRRYGAKAFVLAKFVPGFNVSAPLLATVSGMSSLRFVILDSVASFFWAGGYMTLGYVLSGQLQRAAMYGSELGTTLVGLLIAAAVFFMSVKLIKLARKQVGYAIVGNHDPR